MFIQSAVQILHRTNSMVDPWHDIRKYSSNELYPSPSKIHKAGDWIGPLG